MTTQWGAPLTGEQMKALRDAGLPDGTNYSIHNPLLAEGKFSTPTINEWTTFAEHELITYKLPINHTAYTLLEKGWLDIPNVRLWFGGDKAPDDWGGGRLLLSNGEWISSAMIEDRDWKHGTEDKYDIIAYIAKAEHREETVNACQSFDDTVTLNKMAEADIDAWIAKSPLRIAHNDARNVFAELGLIKPEPTIEERFWAKFPTPYTDIEASNRLKGWVKLALEFERV